MNRRGHIGTALLVFGAFILVVFALYTMVLKGQDLSSIKSELRTSSDFAEANHKFVLDSVKGIVVKSIGESKGSIDFEKSFNESLKKYSTEKRESGLNTNLYAKMSLGEYSLTLNDEIYELIVSDVFENYNMNGHEIVYDYSLKVVFDKNGIASLEEDL